MLCKQAVWRTESASFDIDPRWIRHPVRAPKPLILLVEMGDFGATLAE
jgi:hypothetical protein